MSWKNEAEISVMHVFVQLDQPRYAIRTPLLGVIKDTAADINRWCALKEPATGVGGDFYMMLADDGSICLHAGSYSATSPNR